VRSSTFRALAAVLGLTAVVAACDSGDSEPPATTEASLPPATSAEVQRPDAWYKFQDYRTKPHYRAFALSTNDPNADLSANASFGQDQAWAFGRAWRFNRVEDAIATALESCEAAKQAYKTVQPCQVYAIGDLEVLGLSEPELASAIARYQENPELGSSTTATTAAATTAAATSATSASSTTSTSQQAQPAATSEPATTATQSAEPQSPSATASSTAGGQFLSNSEIRSLLLGNTIDGYDTGNPFRQSYPTESVTRAKWVAYALASQGQWKVEDDQYCELWAQWRCFKVQREGGSSYTFLSEDGEATPFTVTKGIVNF
jgi:hypothetical protein